MVKYQENSIKGRKKKEYTYNQNMTTQQPMGIQFLKTTFTIKYMWKKHGTAQIEKEKKKESAQ